MKSITKGFGVADAKRDIPSPYLTANIFSKVTLWHLNNHIWRGFKRPLSPTDIYTVVPTERSSRRAHLLDINWNCLSKEDKRKKNSLLKAVMMNDWKLLTLSILLMFVGEISKFIQPFLITQIVSYFKRKQYVTEGQTWGYAFGMVFLTIVYALFSTYGQYLGQIVAMRMRTACTALMARKALKLSSKALNEVSTATVINLLATDVEKFYNAATEFNGLFLGPAVLLSVLLYIAVEVDLSIIPAFVFVLLFTAARMKIGLMAGVLRSKFAKLSDKRILLVSEIIAAIRTIKAFCWEFSFVKRAQHIRSQEVKKAGYVMFLNSINLNLGVSCDKIVTFLLVTTFVLSGHYVDYKLAVQVLTWMKMAQIGLLDFPIGFSMWKQMEASVKRMQDFLLAEEFVGFERVRKESTIGSREKVKLVLKNVCASWDLQGKNVNKSTKMLKSSLLRSISTMNAITSRDPFVASGSFSLHNINLEVKNGTLVGVVGPVGSGKTSLLLVILGNLPAATGLRRLKGKIAYVSQEPWIRADTVRNNILMGSKMDRKRYQAVIKACALQKEIAAMSHGDLTHIGDRGNTLSGGQKSRISLARAVYKNADIYILDDPFSSLDSVIGTHIFHECVRGLLKQKLIVMATHYAHLLNHMDRVVLLEKGKIVASGSLDELKKDLNLLTREPRLNLLEYKSETPDVYARQDSIALAMNLLHNPNIKKEHAHVPKKRATPFHVYLSYWDAGRGLILMTLAGLLLLASQAMSVTGDWWLVYVLSGHSSSYAKDSYYPVKNGSSINITSSNSTPPFNFYSPNFTVYNSPDERTANFAAAPGSYSEKDIEYQSDDLGFYALFVWLAFLFGIVSAVLGSLFTVLASKNLYNRMFTKVIWAPMYIFSSDRIGQMMNRFARDTGRMDDIIPITINATSVTAAVMLSQMAYICMVNVYVVVATLPFLVCLFLFVAYCVRAIRDTKRLESEFRTPTFEHLHHVFDGQEVIRAYEMEPTLLKEGDALLDRHTAAWHMYIGSMYWMKMRLKCLVSVYLAAVLIIEIATPSSPDSATSLGLSLAYIVLFMHKIQYFANYATSLDANMTSVEHVLAYESLPQEDPEDDKTMPPSWPEEATIEVTDVNLKYHGSDEYALKNINLKVASGEKIGIVGRTGAGKTSLFNVILRLSDFEGSVKIGGTETKEIGLHELRGRITFVPQQPMLCTGTIRYNIDPHGRFSDGQIWDVLEKVQLKKKINRLPSRLETHIHTGSHMFSHGEKQLLSMTRVLLDMNKIMILDEMTANADSETDHLMHTILYKDFKDCTILHISHRIETLIHYDKILMIGDGRVVEFGHPHELLENCGNFHTAIQQLGRKEASWITNKARQSFLGQGSPIVRPIEAVRDRKHSRGAVELYKERRKRRTTSSLSLSEISREVIPEDDEPENVTEKQSKPEKSVETESELAMEVRQIICNMDPTIGEESDTSSAHSSIHSDDEDGDDMYMEFLKYGRIGRRWSSLMKASAINLAALAGSKGDESGNEASSESGDALDVSDHSEQIDAEGFTSEQQETPERNVNHGMTNREDNENSDTGDSRCQEKEDQLKVVEDSKISIPDEIEYNSAVIETKKLNHQNGRKYLNGGLKRGKILKRQETVSDDYIFESMNGSDVQTNGNDITILTKSASDSEQVVLVFEEQLQPAESAYQYDNPAFSEA